VQDVVDRAVIERTGALAVTVCGPGAFADSVRDAVRKRVKVGVVDFVEEAFTY
jgi:predicted ferric reductase